MELWTVVRFLHVVGVLFFVGGQLMLVAAVAPALRRHGTDAAMRDVARRFGVGSGLALVLLGATGVVLASHEAQWSSPTLHLKLAVIALVGVLLAVHVRRPRSRPLSLALLGASLVVVWLGLRL
jgi:uncharacterized membrane protein